MPHRNRPSLGRVTGPVLRTAMGDGRRRHVVERAAARLPRWGRPRVDMTGWSAPELLAYLETPLGRQRPAPRAGADVVRQVNAHADVLPGEAVVLSRAITDTAPPAGESVNPTLRSVLESYLPESLRAFTAGGRPAHAGPAQDLLLAQLRLLHHVAVEVQRADAQQNDLALKVQDAFLRERFAELTPSDLSLPRPQDTSWLPEPAEVDLPTRPEEPVGAAHARVDADPVVAFAEPASGEPKLTFRLALPKGHPTRLGAVLQTDQGQVLFRHTAVRRWLPGRRQTGFRAPQSDLTLLIPWRGLRRVLVYAHSPARAEPTPCVLFVRDTRRAQTALETLLANRPEAALTVMCSGYVTRDGMIVRNESTLFPTLQAACQGFGYSSVTWLDEHTPIV